MNSITTVYFICFFVSFVTTAISTHVLIAPLKKTAPQPIYEEGPEWHLTKLGTPTMGGMCFIIASIASLVSLIPILLSPVYAEQSSSLLITFGFAALNSTVGIADDLVKLKRNKNAGLTPIQKIIMQLIIISLFLFLRFKLFSDETSIVLFGTKIELGFLYYIVCAFVLLGIINCANLTDGVDGLAASVAFTIGIALFLFFHTNILSTALVSLILSGMCLAFLLFNINPAKIFMGDTGSLFLGALICGACFSLDMPLMPIPLGIVYVIEGVSVILQVLYFKARGKRLFKMAPLHHHLEKCGFSETKICMIAMLITLVCAELAFLLI